jgi:hypothetical protein
MRPALISSLSTLGVVAALAAGPVFLPASALPGTVTYDLVRYTPPAPWKGLSWEKDLKKDDHSTSYTVIDPKARTYCQIFVLRSRPSQGSLAQDFQVEWKDIVVSNYHVSAAPNQTDTAAEAGWQAKAGVATFAFDGGTSIAMLTTLRGYDRAVSIVAVTSSPDYLPAVQALLGSVELIKPAMGASGGTPSAEKVRPAQTAQPAALQGYMDYNPFTKSWTWKVRYPPPK